MVPMVQCHFSWGYVENIFHIDMLYVGSHYSNSEFHFHLSFFILTSVSKSLIYIVTIIFRYYSVALPSVLNMFSARSYLIISSIIGGQALAAVSDKLEIFVRIVHFCHHFAYLNTRAKPQNEDFIYTYLGFLLPTYVTSAPLTAHTTKSVFHKTQKKYDWGHNRNC